MSETGEESHFSLRNVAKVTSSGFFGSWNIPTKSLPNEKVLLLVDILSLTRPNPKWCVVLLFVYSSMTQFLFDPANISSAYPLCLFVQ